MGFDSFGYILIFLPAITILCQLARRISSSKGPQACILVASIVFYAWPNPSFLPVLLASVLMNWLLAQCIGRSTGIWRKRILELGLILNIGLLCLFKYLSFMMANVSFLAHHDFQVPKLAFPLGISFFTITQIMYLVDCYEEQIPPSSLFDHATFVSLFPYVISGPISRPKRILNQFPELNEGKGPSADLVARAMFLFSLGLIKKVVLADAFSKAADYGFANISGLSTVEAWCFATAFALQIYFDFSGYSDMAIASAMLLGIEVPRNFDAPLRSLSITEFWQRWHISLTAFITSYLYTPILRSFKKATLLTSVIATLIAMTIAGLWHGPNWTFVVFGAIHGTGLAVNQVWRKKNIPTPPKWLCWGLTLATVDLGFVFFHSPSLQSAMLYFGHLFSIGHFFGLENLRRMDGNSDGMGILLMTLAFSQAIGVAAAFFGKSSDQLSREFQPTWLNYAATTSFTLIALLYLNSNVTKPFIYFAF